MVIGCAVFAAAANALAVELPGVEPLRAAIEDLAETFKGRYPNGREYLARLDRLQNEAEKADGPRGEALRAEFDKLKREALIANPLVSGQPILFVVRPQYPSDHHSTATLFQTGEVNTDRFIGGGAMKTIHFGRGGEVKTLVELPGGVARDPDVHFDGKRIVFSMRHDREDDYHIHQINADGTGLEQLTFGSGLSDVDPIYLPEGRICFASTRDLKYCQCFRNAMVNLYVMEADGSNVRQIGRNDLSEAHPSLMADGRILYDRWEYVDRHYGPSFGLWTMHPEGTRQALFYGNNAWSPGAIHDARIIPGTGRLVAVLGACHDRPWGAVAIIDRGRGLDGMDPLVRTWPADVRRFMSNRRVFRGDNDLYDPRRAQMSPTGHPSTPQIDLFKSLRPKYEDPYPLSEKHFLCSRMTGKGEQTALFLLDVFGNEIMLHQEGPGCFDPMPIAAGPRPRVLPSGVDPAGETGTFYVADVYRGTGMETVPRGAIKTLRVVEAPPKRFWTVQAWGWDSQVSPAMNFNSTNNKRILGDAPVESDGSAYFQVPADKFIFFQALDADGMMVQSMRSGTTVRPGETIGCVGCHEDRLSTLRPGSGLGPMALRRAASSLKPWYGPPREFNYLSEVQPVFDKHCVSCHDYGKEAGEGLNLAGDLGLVFNTSYLEIRRKSSLRWFPEGVDADKRLVKVVDDGPPEVLPPYAWGSHRSKLVDVIRAEHYDVRLDHQSIDRIVTWIDVNAPYYGAYASAYRDNQFGRSPLDPGQLARLRELTGVPLDSGRMGAELTGSPVNFTRPELSPCLARFQDKNDPGYPEALAIIRAGRQMLAKRPRADMPGFQPVSRQDLIRRDKHDFQTKMEAQARQAVLEGKKYHEKAARLEQSKILLASRPSGGLVAPGGMRYVDLTGSLGKAAIVGNSLRIDHTAGSGGAKTVGVDHNFSDLAGKKYSVGTRFVFNDRANPRSWNAVRLDEENRNEVVGADLEFLARRTGWWRVYSHGKEIAGDDTSLPAAMQYDVQLTVDETGATKTYEVVVEGIKLVEGAPFVPDAGGSRHVALKHFGYGPADGYAFDYLTVRQLSDQPTPQRRPEFHDDFGGLSDRGGGKAPDEESPFPRQVEADWLRQDAVRGIPPESLPPITPQEDAQGAIDEFKDGQYGFHTALEENPWWQIDLGDRAVDQVHVYNRCDRFAERAWNLRLLISDDGVTWKEVYRHDGTPFYGFDGNPLVVHLHNTKVQHLRIQLPGKTCLHLDEVEVYSVPHPYPHDHNWARHRPVTQSSVSRWSNRTVPPTEKVKDGGMAAAVAIQRGGLLADNLRRMGVNVDAPVQQLKQVAGQLEQLPREASEQVKRDLSFQARWAVRKMALANPLLDFDDLLFVKRNRPKIDHMSDQYYGWWSRPGGGLYVLADFKSDSPKLRCLTKDLPPGNIIRPDVSHDGKKVLFAYCKFYPGVAAEKNKLDKSKIPEDAFFNLYEMNLDGTGLRRLTRGKYDDFDGRYLPSGRIVFLSTRRGQYVQCTKATAAASSDGQLPDAYLRCGGTEERPIAVYTLHVMDADGKNLQQISPFEMFEWTPSVDHQGRILFCRWDYLDRYNIPYMSLWSTMPDGTNSQALFGNNTHNPMCTFEPRAIPGSQKLIFTASAHHAVTGGSLVLLDLNKGADGQPPMTRLTPEVPFPEVEGWSGAYYVNPYPLSEDHYLVAWSDQPLLSKTNPGIYLLDRFGNLNLIYRDAKIGCMYPLPIRPRRRPLEVSPVVDWDGPQEGRMLLLDVYRGLEAIAKGTVLVKRLRIVGIPPKTHPVMNNPSLSSIYDESPGKFVIGTVPVEEDGSAYFRVPSGVPFFMQPLDEQGMAVQSMRSHTYVQPGQTHTCIGCHEPRNTAPPDLHAIAMKREPSKIAPGPEGSWPLDFLTLVQPVMEEHCVACHKPGAEGAEFDLTAANSYDALVNFGQPSLTDLMRTRYRQGRSVAGACGAKMNPLVKLLREGHYDVKLAPGQWERLITWMDTYGHRVGSFGADQEERLRRLRQRMAPMLAN